MNPEEERLVVEANVLGKVKDRHPRNEASEVKDEYLEPKVLKF